MKDENLVVQEYHDCWMVARTELLRVVSHLWLTDPKRIKARRLKRIKKSQNQFCDW